MKNTLRKLFTVKGSSESQDSQLSIYERVVLSLGVLLLVTMVVNAGWSYVLLETGNTAGGGPLGALAGLLRLEWFTCSV